MNRRIKFYLPILFLAGLLLAGLPKPVFATNDFTVTAENTSAFTVCPNSGSVTIYSFRITNNTGVAQAVTLMNFTFTTTGGGSISNMNLYSGIEYEETNCQITNSQETFGQFYQSYSDLQIAGQIDIPAGQTECYYLTIPFNFNYPAPLGATYQLAPAYIAAKLIGSASFNSTNINGPIITLSACGTDTVTPTFTSTPTSTSTSTSSPTFTSTMTATNSSTSPPTLTATNSATNTPTPTSTVIPSNTSTNTIGATPTNTWALTNTTTLTDSPTSTTEASPTATATNTLSFTPILTPSGTPSFTATDSATNTPTASSTQGNTSTMTMVVTLAPSDTNTLTPTVDWTQTPMPTTTSTATSVPYVFTATATVATSHPLIYPNPCRGPQIQMVLPVSNASAVKVRIFTVGLREVESMTLSQVTGNTIPLSMVDKAGVQLANGIYYFVIQVNGSRWTEKVLVIR